MSAPTIQSVDDKINRFIDSQDKHNDTVTSAIKEISAAISKMDSFQIEMNNQNEKITECNKKIDKLETKLDDVSDKVIINTALTEEFKHLKKLVFGFVVIAVLGGGYVTKTNTDSSARKDAILEKQAKSMSDIANSIKKEMDVH